MWIFLCKDEFFLQNWHILKLFFTRNRTASQWRACYSQTARWRQFQSLPWNFSMRVAIELEDGVKWFKKNWNINSNVVLDLERESFRSGSVPWEDYLGQIHEWCWLRMVRSKSESSWIDLCVTSRLLLDSSCPIEMTVANCGLAKLSSALSHYRP